MSNLDAQYAHAQKHFAKLEYERGQAMQAGASGGGLDACGPPEWSRAAWEQYKQQFGEYPYSQNHLPPTLEGAPDWAYDLMKMRKPPVQARLGSDGAAFGQADNLAVWRMR